MADAWDFHRFRSRLGPRARIGGLTYERTQEYPWVYNRLFPLPGTRILDLGCGKSIFPLFVGCKHGVGLTLVDADPSMLSVQKSQIRRLRLNPAQFRLCVADAAILPFPDAVFDRVTAISSLEHFPGDNDRLAAAEAARVLRPGGRMLLTLPMHFEFREEFRSTRQGPRFFGRLYNHAHLIERIVEPSGLRLHNLEIFGHAGFHFGHFWWHRVPGILKIPFRWMTPVFSARFLTKIDALTPAAGECTGCLELVKDN